MLKDIARKFYQDEDYNCSETLLHAANEYYGLGLQEKEMRMMAGFGGGLFTGNICGALSGAAAALSLMVTKDRAHKELDVVRPAMQRLQRNFRNAYGVDSVLCKDIKPVYNRTEKKCWPTVEIASDVLEQTVQELDLR